MNDIAARDPSIIIDPAEPTLTGVTDLNEYQVPDIPEDAPCASDILLMLLLTLFFSCMTRVPPAASPSIDKL